MNRPLVLLILAFSFVSSVDISCNFEQQLDLFKCFGKRLQADAAVTSFYSNKSDVVVQRMIERCDDFLSCLKPVNCYNFFYGYVRFVCEKYSFEGRVVQCFNTINEHFDDVDYDFEECLNQREREADSTIVKECTEKVINSRCHSSVVQGVIKKYGDIFYGHFNRNEQEASGSQIE